MNLKQKEKLVKAIKEDCEIQNQYYCDGQTCAIGKLAKLSRYPLKALRKVNDQNITKIPKLVARIQITFGINCYQQSTIQQINDFEEFRDVRISQILTYIDKIPLTQ